MTTLTQASRQWASRPNDERFESLLLLNAFVQGERRHAREKVLPSRALTAQPVGEDHKSLVIVGPNGGPVQPTHWSFGQIAELAGAPAGYLRTLPSPLAADNINYGLQIKREVKDIGVLLYQNGGPAQLRASTGPTYGRVWNHEITQALVDRFGDGLTGDFRVPGEFGRQVAVTKANTTLFASDRDMFVFLADEEHRIEVPNRRDGKTGGMARGFFVWNSEVGASKFGVAFFLFDYVCMNRIVWGAQDYHEISFRHTASAVTHLREKVIPALDVMSRDSAAGVQQVIAAAQTQKIDNVTKFLNARFTRKETLGIIAAHTADEQRPIETLWDATTAVTAYARDIKYQSERVSIERKGGKILQLAGTLPVIDVEFEEA